MSEPLRTAQTTNIKKKRFQPVVIVVAVSRSSSQHGHWLDSCETPSRSDGSTLHSFQYERWSMPKPSLLAPHPDVGYSCTLSQLPLDGWIEGLKKNERRNGYTFTVGGCRPADGKKPNIAYYVIARPLHRDMPAFCSDQSGIVKSDESGSIERCLHSGVP
jgi:hypothetical protein